MEFFYFLFFLLLLQQISVAKFWPLHSMIKWVVWYYAMFIFLKKCMCLALVLWHCFQLVCGLDSPQPPPPLSQNRARCRLGQRGSRSVLCSALKLPMDCFFFCFLLSGVDSAVRHPSLPSSSFVNSWMCCCETLSSSLTSSFPFSEDHYCHFYCRRLSYVCLFCLFLAD